MALALAWLGVVAPEVKNANWLLLLDWESECSRYDYLFSFRYNGILLSLPIMALLDSSSGRHVGSDSGRTFPRQMR